MSIVEDLHRAHKARLLRMEMRAFKTLPKPPAPYEIPNTPFGVPKIKFAVDCGWKPEDISYNDAWSVEIQGSSDFVAPYAPTIESIQKRVCRHFNVTRMDLLSHRKTKDIVRPRQIAMFVAKTLTLKSLPEIGRRFGNRDHTTVLHAVRKIALLIKSDQSLASDVAHIRAPFEVA